MNVIATPSPARDRELAPGRGEGIDREIGPRAAARRRIASVLAAVLLLGLAAFGARLLFAGSRRLHVDRRLLTIAVVHRAILHDTIAAVGTVLPRTTVFLDAVQGGRIDAVLARVGSLVVRGQPVLQLSNDDLQMRLIAADAQRLQQISALREVRSRMEQEALAMRQQLADLDYQTHRLDGQVRRDEQLFANQLIPRQSLEQCRDELAYYRRKRALAEESLNHESERLAVQASQVEAGVASLQSGYDLMRAVTRELQLKAPVSGQLTALNAEVGEMKSPGAHLGQIDVLADGYRVRALIDEFYLARIERGKAAVTAAGGPMVVTHVDSEVRESRFAVDLDFVSPPPVASVRRGQTIGVQIELGAPVAAVVVPGGGFYRTTGGSWVYRLVSPNHAERHAVRLGRSSGDLIEVLAGLSPGDRIITSAYDAFGDALELVLD